MGSLGIFDNDSASWEVNKHTFHGYTAIDGNYFMVSYHGTIQLGLFSNQTTYEKIEVCP